jgi:hypothetical protein
MDYFIVTIRFFGDFRKNFVKKSKRNYYYFFFSLHQNWKKRKRMRIVMKIYGEAKKRMIG